MVSSPYWDNGAAADAGAVDLGERDERGHRRGLSAANSLVGSTADDQVGYGVTALSQRQLCGAQPLLGQRRGGGCRGGHLGERDSGHHGHGLAANSLVGSTAGDRSAHWT